MKVDIVATDQIDKNSHFSLIFDSLKFSPFYNIPKVENVINSHLDKLIRNPDSGRDARQGA